MTYFYHIIMFSSRWIFHLGLVYQKKNTSLSFFFFRPFLVAVNILVVQSKYIFRSDASPFPIFKNLECLRHFTLFTLHQSKTMLCFTCQICIHGKLLLHTYYAIHIKQRTSVHPSGSWVASRL